MASKDQGSLDVRDECQDTKWNRALDIFIESVHKPDNALRGCSHNQECYNELMWVREHVIEYLSTLRREIN